MRKRILIAGATGYLGRYVTKAFKEQGYFVKVLVRSRNSINNQGSFGSPRIEKYVDEIVIGDVTDKDILKDICEDIDVVFSSVGITRQKGRQTFEDVDYQGNVNLLREAEKSLVKKFMYVNVFGAKECPSGMIQAKQKFVDTLSNSPISHIVVNPTGYYSDLTEVLKMAKKGTVFLFGDGNSQMNPIHGADLAEVCVVSINGEETVLNVGGPETYTYREMANLCFNILGKKPRIISVPLWIMKIVLPMIKIVNKKQYDLLVFFYFMMTKTLVTDSYGNRKLESHFRKMVDSNFV